MKKREKLHVKRRILRDAVLLALALALLFGLTGASPTPGLALRRTLDGAHFGPYEIEAQFSLPDLNCYHQDAHYYLARCQDWYYLSVVERYAGFLWRQEHPALIGPLPDGPLYCRFIDFVYHAQCRLLSNGPSYQSVEIVEPGTTSAWLVRCTDSAVVRVELDELRTYEDGRSDLATAGARSVGEGFWVVELRRPALDGAGAVDLPSLAIGEVRYYDAQGRVLYTDSDIVGLSSHHA